MIINYEDIAKVTIEYISLQDSVDTCEVVTIELKDRIITYTIMYDNISEFKIKMI